MCVVLTLMDKVSLSAVSLDPWSVANANSVDAKECVPCVASPRKLLHYFGIVRRATCGCFWCRIRGVAMAGSAQKESEVADGQRCGWPKESGERCSNEGRRSSRVAIRWRWTVGRKEEKERKVWHASNNMRPSIISHPMATTASAIDLDRVGGRGCWGKQHLISR